MRGSDGEADGTALESVDGGRGWERSLEGRRVRSGNLEIIFRVRPV